MSEYLPLPDGNFVTVREGENPSQTWARALRDYPASFGFPETKKVEEDKSGFKAAAAAQTERMKGEAALLAGKIGLKSPEEAQAYYEAQKKKAEERFKPTEKGWTEDPLLKLRELAGGSAPAMALPLAAGAAAATAPVSGLLGLGSLTAGALGAGALSAAQFTGSNIAAQMEQGKNLEEASLGKAVTAAIPQAMLDVGAQLVLPGVGKLLGRTAAKVTEEEAKALASQAFAKKVADYAWSTGKGSTAEGITEATQQVLERLQAGQGIADPEARADYVENFIGGAALAAVLGPFGRAVERSDIKREGQRLARERAAKEQEAAAKQAEQQRLTQTAYEGLGLGFEQMPSAPGQTPITPELADAQRRLSNLQALYAQQQQQQEDSPQAQRTKQAIDQIQTEIEQYKTQPGIEGLPFSEQAQKAPLTQSEVADQTRQLQALYDSLFEQAKQTPEATQKFSPRLQEIHDALNTLQRQDTTPDIARLNRQLRAATNERISALNSRDYEAAKAAAQKEQTLAAQIANAAPDTVQQTLNLPLKDLAGVESEADYRYRTEQDLIVAQNAMSRETAMNTATPEQGVLFPNVKQKADRDAQIEAFKAQLIDAESKLKAARRTRNGSEVSNQVERIRDLRKAILDIQLEDKLQPNVHPVASKMGPFAGMLPATEEQPWTERQISAALKGLPTTEAGPTSPLTRPETQLHTEKVTPPTETTAPSFAKLLTRAKTNVNNLNSIDEDVLFRIESLAPTITKLTPYVETRTGAKQNPREDIAEWLYRAATRTPSPELTRNVQAHLARAEQAAAMTGAEGETISARGAKYTRNTPEQQAALEGMQTGPLQATSDLFGVDTGPRSNLVTRFAPLVHSEFPLTGETRTEQQAELFPEVATGVRFRTAKEFQDYLGSHELQLEREEVGNVNRTIQRLNLLITRAKQRAEQLHQRTVAFARHYAGTRHKGESDIDLLKRVANAEAKERDVLVGQASGLVSTARGELDTLVKMLENDLRKVRTEYKTADLALTKAQNLADHYLQEIRAHHENFDTLLAEQEKHDARVRAVAQNQRIVVRALNNLEAARKELARRSLGEGDVSEYEKRVKDLYQDVLLAENRVNAMVKAVGLQNKFATIGPEAFRDFLMRDAALHELAAHTRRKLSGLVTQRNKLGKILADAYTVQGKDPTVIELFNDAIDTINAAGLIYVETAKTAREAEQRNVSEINSTIAQLESQLSQIADSPTLTASREKFGALSERIKRLEEERARVVAAGEARKGTPPTIKTPVRPTVAEQTQNEQRELERQQYPEYTTRTGEPLRPRQVVFTETQKQERIAEISSLIEDKFDALTKARSDNGRAKARRAIAKLRKELSDIRGTTITEVPTRAELEAEARAELARQEKTRGELTSEDIRVQRIEATQTRSRATGAVTRSTKTPPNVLKGKKLTTGVEGKVRNKMAEELAAEGPGHTRRPLEEAHAPLSPAQQKGKLAGILVREFGYKLEELAGKDLDTLANMVETARAEGQTKVTKSARQSQKKALAKAFSQGIGSEARVTAAKNDAAALMPEVEAAVKEAANGVSDAALRENNDFYAPRDTTKLTKPVSAALEKGTVETLDALAEHGSTPFIREVATRLRDAGVTSNIAVQDEVLFDGVPVEGYYDPETDTVYLSSKHLSEETTVHELVHPATLAIIDAAEKSDYTMTRRQFLKGAAATMGALKLPKISEGMTLDQQVEAFQGLLGNLNSWVDAAYTALPKGLQNKLSADMLEYSPESSGKLIGFLWDVSEGDFGGTEGTQDYIRSRLEDSPNTLKDLEKFAQHVRQNFIDAVQKAGGTQERAGKVRLTLTEAQRNAYNELKQLYGNLKTKEAFANEYGVKDLKEFVSELLSNKNLRDKIDETAGLLRRIYNAFLRLLGVNPQSLSEAAVQNAYRLFQPSGTATKVNVEGVASSMRGIFPATRPQADPSVPEGLVRMSERLVGKNASLADVIAARSTGLYLRTAILDRWAPIDALIKGAVGKLSENQIMGARFAMRVYEQINHFVAAAATTGVPQLQEADENGIRIIESEPGANLRNVFKHLNKAGVGNEAFTEQLFTTYMAIQRKGAGNKQINIAHPPTTEEVNELNEFLDTHPEAKAAFEAARKEYKQYNHDLIKLLRDTRVLDKATADSLIDGDYVPFYRERNGVVEMVGGNGVMRVGSVVDQPELKQLLGGEDKIMPLAASSLQNTQHILRMALRNTQAHTVSNLLQDMGLAQIIPGEGPKGKTIHFKRDGEDYWVKLDQEAFPEGVDPELVLMGMQGIKTAIPTVVRMMSYPAGVLRKWITRIPVYALRQTVRDSAHAWLTTGGDFTPMLSTFREFGKMATGKSETEQILNRGAVISSNVFTGTDEDIDRLLRELNPNKSKWNAALAQLDALAIRGDAATRAVLYNEYRAKGMSHAEALLGTLESMNFSRRGTSSSLHWLSTMIPFFNAQLQGLDAVYRAAKGDTVFEDKMDVRAQLVKRGLLMAGATVAYAAMMQDDEAYKNATPEERASYWFLRTPFFKEPLRIPIPFELGIAFKVLPELFYNTAAGDTKAADAASAFLKTVASQNPLGLPTGIKGPLELMANYNFYSHLPIESEHEKGLRPSERFRANTTELAKLLGQAEIVSPVQIEHLVRSYTGGLGIALMSAFDTVLRPVTDNAEPPEKLPHEMQIVGSLFQPNDGRGMINAVFNDIKDFQQAAQTYKALIARDPDAAAEFANKFSAQIALAQTGGAFKQRMGEFANMKRQIAASKDLTPAQKREQIDQVRQYEIEYAKQVREIINAS